MKTLQEQINEQIEFCNKVMQENPLVFNMMVTIENASPQEMKDVQLFFKDKYVADIDTIGDKLRMHLRDGNWAVFVKSYALKIHTVTTYEPLI